MNSHGASHGPILKVAEERMWELVQQYTNQVGYQRGAKAPSIDDRPPVIDCSGWVALLLTEAMKAQNADDDSHIFDTSVIDASNTWSERIISDIEARTQILLEGRNITLTSLARCATIGLNEGYFSWQENHPRQRGINHIIQIVRRPTDDTPFVSESHSNFGGVHLTPLGEWLEAHIENIQKGNVWAVDPFAMAKFSSHK